MIARLHLRILTHSHVIPGLESGVDAAKEDAGISEDKITDRQYTITDLNLVDTDIDHFKQRTASTSILIISSKATAPQRRTSTMLRQTKRQTKL